MVEDDIFENKELTQKTDNEPILKKPCRWYETIIRSKKKRIVNFVHRQGIMFKRFMEYDKFMEKIKGIRVIS